MNILIALFLILFAGIINGSFALPTKHISRWNFENIWLQYAFWAFILLPWIIIFFLAPQVFQIYSATPAHIIWIMIIGGFLFGAGQVGFAFAIDMIGIGLAFVICLGIGTGLGFLLPLLFQHPDKIFTLFGGLTLLGTALAILGLIVSTYAGGLRDRYRKNALENQPTLNNKKHYKIGVLLATIAGLFSAGQNFSFSLTTPMQHTALALGATPLGAANIMWPGFLFFTFLPYAGYMLYLHANNKSFSHYRRSATKKYYLFALLMGFCWYGSLIFYSKASQLIGTIGPIVGWPLFMVLVILTSNFWGWKHQEWLGCDRKIKTILWLGLILLILSVIVLGFSSHVGKFN